MGYAEDTHRRGGRITVQLVYILTRLDLTKKIKHLYVVKQLNSSF